MPFNKLQPSQIQLPNFYSRSGHLYFQDLSTGYNVNLSRLITGDFNLYGSLTLNSGIILSSDSSNVSDLINGNKIFGGNNNIANGLNNSIIAGFSNYISGYNNIVLNGNNLFFESGSRFNTCLAGYRNTFAENIIGSSNLSSNEVSSEVSIDNSLLVKFANGTNISGSNVNFETDIILPSYSEAIFSGNLNVKGTSFFNGEVYVKNNTKIENYFDILGISEFSSGAFFKDGNLYVNADIEFDQSTYISGSINHTGGSINSTYLSGINFNCSNLTGSSLNTLTSATLTGSNILTQSALNDKRFIAFDTRLNNLLVTGEITANLGLFNNIIITGNKGFSTASTYPDIDYIKCNYAFITGDSFSVIQSIVGPNSTKIKRVIIEQDILVDDGSPSEYKELNVNVVGARSGDICLAISAVGEYDSIPVESPSNQYPYIRYAKCISGNYVDINYFFPSDAYSSSDTPINIMVIGLD